MLEMREAVVYLVIITKGEMEGSMRRMRVFAWRVDVSGGETGWLTIKPRALLVLSKYRTGQDRTGESDSTVL